MELDCGSNSCKYAKHITGMRTNGLCQCLRNHPQHVELHLRQRLAKALLILDEGSKTVKDLTKNMKSGGGNPHPFIQKVYDFKNRLDEK